MNSKSAAASHQLSSFFGASVGFGVAFACAVLKAGVGADADFWVLAGRSGWI